MGNLKQERVLAEARRVFYVAVTRAQTRLFLSGVLPVRKNGAAPPQGSPLAWLWQHYRPGGLTPGVQLWPDPPLRVEALPEPGPDSTPGRRIKAAAPALGFYPGAAALQPLFPIPGGRRGLERGSAGVRNAP